MLSSVQKHQWIFSQYCIWGDSLCILCVKYSYLWCVWKLTLPLPCEEILHEFWRLVWAGGLSQTGSGGMMEPAGLRVSPASPLLILHSDPTLTITYNNYYQHHQDITTACTHSRHIDQEQSTLQQWCLVFRQYYWIGILQDIRIANFIRVGLVDCEVLYSLVNWAWYKMSTKWMLIE